MKRNLISVLTAVITLVACFFLWNAFKFKPDRWRVSFLELGSSSSPQAMDLTGDGIKDIVMGAGAVEFTRTDKGIIALDGRDGKLLWKVAARNQVVGSPVFMDINQDGVPEVFIGGRSALLYCINGVSGDVVWEYLP